MWFKIHLLTQSFYSDFFLYLFFFLVISFNDAFGYKGQYVANLVFTCLQNGQVPPPDLAMVQDQLRDVSLVKMDFVQYMWGTLFFTLQCCLSNCNWKMCQSLPILEAFVFIIVCKLILMLV